MSTPMSVKERIAMMSVNKGSPSSSNVSTTSNPASNGPRTSVADRLAALKASSSEPSPAKESTLLSTPQKSKNTENPIGREFVANPAAVSATSSEPSIENKASEETKQRRPSTIADRIAALNKPSSHEPLQPLSQFQLKPAKMPNPIALSSPIVDDNDIVKEKVSSPLAPAAAQPVPPAAAENASDKATKYGEKTLTTPKKEEFETLTTTVDVAVAVTPISENTNNNSENSSSVSKPSGVTTKIAAMKSGAVALPMFSPPVAAKEGGAVRRMSSDMKNLGAKINLGGLIPGAPRPPMPRPSVHYAEETVTEDNNTTTRTSLSGNVNGELHHASLSRPGVNATRKRAISSVKLSAAWREELDSEDKDVVAKHSMSASSATAEEIENALTLTAGAITASDNNDTATTAEL